MIPEADSHRCWICGKRIWIDSGPVRPMPGKLIHSRECKGNVTRERGREYTAAIAAKWPEINRLKKQKIDWTEIAERTGIVCSVQTLRRKYYEIMRERAL